MANKYICGVDIGTTGVKAEIYDLSGELVASAYTEYNCIFPRNGWVDQDGEMLFRESCKTLKMAVEKAAGVGVKNTDIVSLGVSSQRAAVSPVDENGIPLTLDLSWQDRRTTEELADIDREIGARRFYEITGQTLDTTWSISKIMWFKKHRPEIYEKAYKFVNNQERFLRRLGAEDFGQDFSNSSLFGISDVQNFCWSEELCEKLGIDMEKLPKLIQSGQQVGVISKEAAELTGFAEGMPICTGGGDQQCAAVGAGVIEEGIVEITLGTSGVSVAHVENPVYSDTMALPLSYSCIPGKWEVEGLQMAAGSSYKWYRDKLAYPETQAANVLGVDPYDLINANIEKVPPCCDGVFCLPFFAGAGAPYWNPYARGTLIGMTLNTDRNVIARAVMEGVTYECKNILDAMMNMGIKLDKVLLTGSATKSPTWNKIQTDIYGMECHVVKNNQATTLGAAILGAVGVGVFDNIKEAVNNLQGIKQTLEPDMKLHAQYQEMLAVWRDAYKALNDAQIYQKLEKFH